ncbi:alcohol dehydrogenase catalytic domain-containing protein [Amycolatopsis sp. NBC_00345]|uniref:alcohol dehydrogenase catalytic domain-containing protein n=1 Tax=Amycolatopsis sp. NBC_00345 TaxID=2975955 RepID=UPI002E268832
MTASAATDRAGELPTTMRAMVMRARGEPSVLRMEEIATPVPGPGEVVVRVGAVEVSRSRDVATRTGQHPYSRQLTLPHVLGGDFAGIVASLGAGVDGSLLGARVAVMNHQTCGSCAACRAGREDDCSALTMLGIHRPGSYAEYALVRVDQVHRLPEDIDLVQAAALAATGPVALTQLVAGRVEAGTTVLLTGLSGALASTLACLSGARGARVVGLTRRPAEIDPALGVTVLDLAHADLAGAIVAETGGGPQVVVDNICVPEIFGAYYPILPNGARVVISGALDASGPPVLAVHARTLYLRSISLLGVRSHTASVTDQFWRLVRDGFRIPRTVLHEYPLAQAADVHDAVARNATAGHTILRVSPESLEK